MLLFYFKLNMHFTCLYGYCTVHCSVYSWEGKTMRIFTLVYFLLKNTFSFALTNLCIPCNNIIPFLSKLRIRYGNENCYLEYLGKTTWSSKNSKMWLLRHFLKSWKHCQIFLCSFFQTFVYILYLNRPRFHCVFNI